MNTQDNGGPAFSSLFRIDKEEFEHLRGMTLRDYFAAKAMQQVMTPNPVTGQYPSESDFADVAKIAYLMANAMLKARNN